MMASVQNMVKDAAADGLARGRHALDLGAGHSWLTRSCGHAHAALCPEPGSGLTPVGSTPRDESQDQRIPARAGALDVSRVADSPAERPQEVVLFSCQPDR